ncbi:MAG: transposase [Opitutales bacterium]
MDDYILWTEWSQAFSCLRNAFSRQMTFTWYMIACVGMSVRTDLVGITGIVRALGLRESAYHCLIRVFHSSGINREALLASWIAVVMEKFEPACIDGRLILICDGINIAKEGRRMPGVRLIHQNSSSNAKAEFIMGHYLQSVSLAVVDSCHRLQAVPLQAEIHDGVIRTHRGAQSRVEKMAGLNNRITEIAGHPAVIVADAYYAGKSMIAGLSDGSCLVSRVKTNAVAYSVPEKEAPRRGRPRKYGKKISLKEKLAKVQESQQCWNDYRLTHLDLIWPPAGRMVRFVLTHHSTKGSCILVSTDLNFDPLTILRIYIARWNIESGFKTSKHVYGAFNYHFWSKSMGKLTRKSGGIRLVGHSAKFRNKIENKINAFHNHITSGYIAHGLAMYLGINKPQQVWSTFSGWLRTINKDMNPSDLVVKNALATALPEYLMSNNDTEDWRKILMQYTDTERSGPLTKSG